MKILFLNLLSRNDSFLRKWEKTNFTDHKMFCGGLECLYMIKYIRFFKELNGVM